MNSFSQRQNLPLTGSSVHSLHRFWYHPPRSLCKRENLTAHKTPKSSGIRSFSKRSKPAVVIMPRHTWRVYACILLGCMLVEAAVAGRSPQERLPELSEGLQTTNIPKAPGQRPLSVSAIGPRSVSLGRQQPASDQSQDVAPAAFGDYHYQDEANVRQLISSRATTQSDHDADYQGLVSSDAEEQRQAYMLEDQAGRVSVIEKETRDLSDGGHIVWQRATGPDGVTVTTVATNSHSDSSSSLFTASNHFSSSSGFFSGAVDSALTPLNQILDALDAQQQQLSGLMMSRFMHTAAAAQQQQQMPYMVHRRPCPKHQAMMAAAAAQQQDEQQQEYEAQDEQQQCASFAEKFAIQQEDELVRLSREQQLQDILEANGLALSESGVVIPLDEAQSLAAAAAAPDQPDVDDFYLEYAEPAQVEKDFADTAYDVDDDYVESLATDLDYELDAASMGDYSSGLAAFLNSLGQSLDGIEFDSWFDVDVLLLVLLVACTVGMCMLFLQSLLQLRTVLASGSNLDVATLPICAAGPYPVAVAAGYKGSSSSRRDSADDLSLPLLIADDTESAAEQQQQQPAAAIQRFYNPMHYQPLPGKL